MLSATLKPIEVGQWVAWAVGTRQSSLHFGEVVSVKPFKVDVKTGGRTPPPERVAQIPPVDPRRVVGMFIDLEKPSVAWTQGQWYITYRSQRNAATPCRIVDSDWNGMVVMTPDGEQQISSSAFNYNHRIYQ